MKLDWKRLEEIVSAKVRMADDSATAAIASVYTSGVRDVPLDTIVRVRECKARGNTALAILNELREAETLAEKKFDDRIVVCCAKCKSIDPGYDAAEGGDTFACEACGSLAIAMGLQQALDTWEET